MQNSTHSLSNFKEEKIMNEKVKRFLEDSEKAAILCDLGLCEKEYSPSGEETPEYPLYDAEKKCYYKEIPIAVTDEEWESIKKKALENAELKKATQAARGKNVGNDIVALLLTGIAAVLYVGGFIAGIVFKDKLDSAAVMFGIWTAAFVEGTVMLGFARIIKLLDKIGKGCN